MDKGTCSVECLPLAKQLLETAAAKDATVPQSKDNNFRVVGALNAYYMNS